MSVHGAVHWFLVLPGITDRDLFGFEADGWQLLYRDPAYGSLGIAAARGGAPASLDDARWLADAIAYDHDAPIGISPAWDGIWPGGVPRDPAAVPANQPIYPFTETQIGYYWEHVNMGYVAAAELRFNGSYELRYEGEEKEEPTTNFSTRFSGREDRVALYAMAARQPDPLSEYLLLYRILEAADSSNGKSFVARHLDKLSRHDFGRLWVSRDSALHPDQRVNAFDVYQDRAQLELGRLHDIGVVDVPACLYGIRNSLAHGKTGPLSSRHKSRTVEAGHALPIIKLLARLAVEAH